LFDIKLKRLKDINLKKINKYSYNLTFNFKNIYFNLSFGDSKQNTWIEEYKLITRDNAFNLKLNSPFNIQSCGELKIENNKSLRTYNNSKFKFKWAYQNQFEYFLKNHKKKNIINQISDCVNQQLLLEKIWIKIN
jgi:hypothetical protein